MAQASREITIRNKLGLHARPAMAFVDVASKFSSTIQVVKGDEAVDGKSIMQMLLLADTQGTQLKIQAEGDDAEDAILALEQLAKECFNED
jgi:phosphotransferase system HPr (HPr) family protein